MQAAAAFVVGLSLLVAPATSSIPFEPTVTQLATRVAALQAEINSMQTGQALACAMLTSTSSVSVGQQAILAWGSVGAVEQTTDTENIRPTNGAQTLLFSQPGTWTYNFMFYSASGATTTCSAKITAHK